MPDYNALVGIEQGGERLFVKDGGVIEIEAGGEILNNGGVVEHTEAIGANATLTRDDSGKIFLVNTADLVITLPPTVAGLTYTFVVESAGLSSGTGLSISPDSANSIRGNGFTAANDKDAINSGGTDVEGDLLTVEGDGVIGWYITEVLGTWARET